MSGFGAHHFIRVREWLGSLRWCKRNAAPSQGVCVCLPLFICDRYAIATHMQGTYNAHATNMQGGYPAVQEGYRASGGGCKWVVPALSEGIREYKLVVRYCRLNGSAMHDRVSSGSDRPACGNSSAQRPPAASHWSWVAASVTRPPSTTTIRSARPGRGRPLPLAAGQVQAQGAGEQPEAGEHGAKFRKEARRARQTPHCPP